MRAVIQRVTRAHVTVEGEITGSIERGLVALIGVHHDDGPSQADKLAAKIQALRIFEDSEQKMNLSVADSGGEVLVVSQFTLYGDARKGNRPSFIQAARPEHAEPLIQAVVDALKAKGVRVATGRFRTDMKVELINDGPVTIVVDID